MRGIRLIIVLAQPAVVMLVALFTAVGLAQAGHANDGALLAKGLVAVLGCLLFAVAVNDLADERIDRVNLPADTCRPLVAGTGTRREMTAVACTSATSSCSPGSTPGSSAASCSRISATCAATRCSASARSWCDTAAGQPAR